MANEHESYEEYARKMDLFENGPETTNFQQLLDNGVQLPEPDSIPDGEIRKKLWEVLAALAGLRVYLDHSDHLTDRELYAKLWREMLRVDTPAIDELGFRTHVSCCEVGSDEETFLYLKHYADDHFREQSLKDFPDQEMPAHEDPPYHRDVLLPCPRDFGLPEALEWLHANWNESALASNRFGPTTEAIRFVEQLYDAGATEIGIDNVMTLPNHEWTPYADTLIVRLPEDRAQRRELFALMKDAGRPDEDGPDSIEELLTDCGQSEVRLPRRSARTPRHRLINSRWPDTLAR